MFIILNKSAYLSAIINIIRSESTNTQVSRCVVGYLGNSMKRVFFIGKNFTTNPDFCLLLADKGVYST